MVDVLADVISFLACPHCSGGLALDGRVVRCVRGHAFDVARQGYVNLLAGRPAPGGGDDAAMVAARERFLAGGHLTPVAEAVASQAERVTTAGLPPGCVADVGAGTGHYLARVLDGLGSAAGGSPGLPSSPPASGLALDASAYAARRAARAHPRIGSVVCDVWQRLPVRDGGVALVLNVFSPRNGQEIARVLGPGGALLVVTPDPRHLHELVDALGTLTVDPDKEQRLDAALGPHLDLEDTHDHTFPMRLDHDDVVALVGMGPSARHVTADDLAERAARLPVPMHVTASVRLSVYRKAR